jgi:hypothetical protein
VDLATRLFAFYRYKFEFVLLNIAKSMSDKKKQQRKPTQAQRNAQSKRDKARKSFPPQGEKKSVAAPVAKAKTIRTQKPKMQTLSNGDCIITHREYVTDIIAGAGNPSLFKAQTLSLNPGQAATFQWLSRIANNYESYLFEYLNIGYETEAPTTLGGTLILTVDYDAADAAPGTKQQAMAYRSSVRSPPWSACSHVSIKEDLQKLKSYFIRIGVQPPNTDIKTYDVGNLFVMSQGVSTAGATLGELYVDYKIKLMTPVFEVYSSLLGGSATGNATQTAANPFGTAPIYAPPSNGFTVNGASLITFSTPGAYLLEFYVLGTVITGDALVSTDATGVVTALEADVINGAGTVLVGTYAFHALQPGASCTYTITGTTVTGAVLFIGAAPIASL